MLGPFRTRSWYDSPIYESPFDGFDCVQDLELTSGRDFTVDKPGRGRLFNVLDARNDRGYCDPCIGILEVKEHSQQTYLWLNHMMRDRRSGSLRFKATLIFFGEKMMREYGDEKNSEPYNHHTLDMLCCLSILTCREFQTHNWATQKWQLARIHCKMYETSERFCLKTVSEIANAHRDEGCLDEGEHLSCIVLRCRDGSFLIDTGMSLDELSHRIENFVLSGCCYSKHVMDITNYISNDA